MGEENLDYFRSALVKLFLSGRSILSFKLHWLLCSVLIFQQVQIANGYRANNSRGKSNWAKVSKVNVRANNFKYSPSKQGQQPIMPSLQTPPDTSTVYRLRRLPQLRDSERAPSPTVEETFFFWEVVLSVLTHSS